MPCHYWKCLLWGHREEFGHEWLRDNITYRIFKDKFGFWGYPVNHFKYQLRCIQNVEWTTVDVQEFTSYMEREMNKRYAQQVQDHIEFVSEDGNAL